MLAVLIFPKDNVAGNLQWLPPYLYPEEHLLSGMALLEEKGYWISAFPEGDGLTFLQENTDQSTMESDFRSAFPWMKIKVYNGEDLNSDPDIEKTQLIILPIDRLRIAEPIFTEDYSVFPPGAFLLNHQEIKKFDGKEFEDTQPTKSLRDHITKVTGIQIEDFERLPVVVFFSKLGDYKEFRSQNHQDDEYLLKQLSTASDGIMNLIKFFNGDYFLPENLPSRPGIWDGRYSAAIIYYPPISTGYIISREVEYKNFIKGIGMDVTDCAKITANPLVHGEIGEVGSIVKHALRLHGAIMETDEPTLKFTQIMTLFEYLASPFGYEKASKVKTKIGVLIAKNKTEYHNFCNRFEEIGGGKEINGVREGYRTMIIHNGERLEDLIPKKADQDALFKELNIYAHTVIMEMLLRSMDSWAEFEQYRDSLKLKLGV